MKKGIIIIFFTLIGLITFLFIYSNNKLTVFDYYSPYESKAYVNNKDREMSFDIYTKEKDSLLLNKDMNTYTLYLDDLSIVLENIRISSFDLGEYYLIRVYSLMPGLTDMEYKSEGCNLEIKNPKYTVKLKYGKISFLKEDAYPLASISGLYGSYSYMNGILIMSGINIILSNHFSYLGSIRIGNTCFGTLSSAIFDLQMENICDITKIIPSYNPKKVEKDHIIGLESNTLFIPLGYKEITLLRSGYIMLTLDDKTYYIDTFDFMTNAYDFNDYKDMMIKGEVIYA
jgi:hypothetical protein